MIQFLLTALAASSVQAAAPDLMPTRVIGAGFYVRDLEAEKA